MRLGKDSFIAPHPDVVFRTVAGERLLVPVRGEGARRRRLFTLNPLGAVIWERLGGGREWEALCVDLQRLYPAIDPERVRSDTERFLGELESRGLIILREGPGHGL